MILLFFGDNKLKKILLAPAFLSCLLIFALLFGGSSVRLVFAADVHGNDINYIEVWQWNGTGYELRANFTSTGQSVRVEENYTIKFVVEIQFNATLAADTAEAISYTRVYMNISEGVWSNEELNNTSCSLIGNFYHLKEEGVWNQTGLPAEGVSYVCQVAYQGYY